MSFVTLILDIVRLATGNIFSFLKAQSPLRLFLLFQALLALAYLGLTIVAAYVFPKSYSATIAIRMPCNPEKVWEHVEDVIKNPISSKMNSKTQMISETEWKEEMGPNEIVMCKTTEAEKPKRMTREMWVEAVKMKGEWTYVLEPTKTGGTVLRIYANVDTLWGSFMTPLLRLTMTYSNGVERGIKDYLELLCKDMGIAYEAAENWE